MLNVKRVQINNFRSLKQIDLRLDAGAFITGNNGAGKSSIFEAVRFALLGFCENTDRRGAGAKGLIADGADEARIDLELEGGVNMAGARVRVVIPREGGVRWSAEDAHTGKPIAAKPDQIWAWCGVSAASLCASLLPGDHVTTQGFDGVLAEFQAGQIDLVTLREACGAEFDVLLADYPAAADGELPRQLATLSGLRAVGEDAYSARREIGRQVKALEAKLPTEPPVPPLDRKGAPLGTDAAAALKKNIGDLSVARDNLLRELGEARQIAKIAAPGDASELKAAAEEAAKAADEARIVSGTAQAAHTKAVAAHEAIEHRIAEVKRELGAVHERIREITETLEGYEVGKPCPACGAKWTAARVKQSTAALREQRMDLTDGIKDRETLIGTLAAHAASTKERAVEAFTAAEAATNAAIAAGTEASQLQRDFELAVRLAGVRTAETVEGEIAAVDERLDRAKNAMAQLALVAGYEAQTQSLTAARARYEHLDWRVRAFRDGTVINKLGADGLKTFEAAVNHTLLSHGYKLAFEVDAKAVKVLMGRRDEALRPIERVSTGERKLAETAVAVAFAEATGLAFIDDLDHLDGGNRNQTLSLIAHVVREGAPSGVGPTQILASGAWGKPGKPDSLERMAQALAPLTIVWVDVEASDVKQTQAAA